MTAPLDDRHAAWADARVGRVARATWTRWPLPLAAAWSLAYLGLGLAWLAGAGGNPADPAVDVGVDLSVLGTWGPQAGASIIIALAATGVLLAVVMTVQRVPGGRLGAGQRVPAVLAGALGLVLAVGLPDFRLLASVAYSPILLVLTLLGAMPEGASLWSWPVVNMAVLSLAGLAWALAAVLHHRRMVGACLACGRRHADPTWMTPASAARWGRWAVAVAVVVPLGYASTRYAWALGIPLGVQQQLLDDLGDGVYAGAALATLAVGGAVLTLGLAQRWGEVFPRWMLGLRGRQVPVGLAVVPATVVSVTVASAGLMFLRFGVTGGFGDTFPGENDDVAAWLPEMFWPLWGAALAAATYAYWLRRRGRCQVCSQG